MQAEVMIKTIECGYKRVGIFGLVYEFIAAGMWKVYWAHLLCNERKIWLALFILALVWPGEINN